MQAVILAAGKSTRTYPLTLTKPKPLLKVANKTLLEHNLEGLNSLEGSNSIVDEAIIVVGYRKGLIKKYIGSRYKNAKIKYVEQKEQLGTGNALLIAEKYIRDKFICLYGDDIYSAEDFKSIIKNKYSILVKKVGNPNQFGVIIEKGNILLDIVEKPEKSVSNLVNTGLYKLDKKIFHIIKKLKKSKRNEYELTDAVKLLSKKEKIHCIMARQWLPIGYPWDLLAADRIIRADKNIKNIVGNNSRVHGNVENSTIGGNCSVYGDIKNSMVMNNTFIDKDSIVEDSVIGENVYFHGNALAGNNVHSVVKGKDVMVDRLGAIIGDNVKAENVMIKPGCKIWPNKRISNRVINKDLI